MKIETATLACDTNGTPWSAAFGDVYHSAESGPGQARHVFLGGNDLPAAWAGRKIFTIVETGFGLGINFLATWQAWRNDPARPARLHFVSIEKHPFTRDDLQTIHRRYTEFADLTPQLHAAWPLPLAGSHRLTFENEGVTLTLVFADVAQALPQLRLAADAFYLDGFSPQRNAAMWEPRLLRTLARLARPDATLATYTAARAVRDALAEAGFVVERRRGFGRKRDMLHARYRPHWQPRHAPPLPPSWPQRRAIVIGAGIAGAALCERLAQRGWSVTLLEHQATAAGGASGMHAGAFHPLLARDDSITARLTRAGFFHALQRWQALAAAGDAPDWQRCGVLQLADAAADANREETRMRETIAALDPPPAYARYVDAAEASELAGLPLRAGGYWFPQGGWMCAASLIAANLASAPIDARFNAPVTRLARIDECNEWQALAADGSVIAAAPVVVLANAADAAQLADFAHPLQQIRGQVAYLAAADAPASRVVLTGAGYLLPVVDGVAVTGASYDVEDKDLTPHAEDLSQFTEQLQQMLGRRIDLTGAGGRVGFRCVAVDRLPLIGAVPDLATARAQASTLTGAHFADLPRLPCLYAATGYGSRGLVWSALAAELIASQLDGEPLPLEADLVDAVDPGRFALKQLRHGTL